VGACGNLGQVEQAGKIDLLWRATCSARRSVYPESKGIYCAGITGDGDAGGAAGAWVISGVDRQDRWGGPLTPPGDAAALADGLAAMLNDPARREHHGRRGRAAVHAELRTTAWRRT